MHQAGELKNRRPRTDNRMLLEKLAQCVATAADRNSGLDSALSDIEFRKGQENRYRAVHWDRAGAAHRANSTLIEQLLGILVQNIMMSGLEVGTDIAQDAHDLGLRDAVPEHEKGRQDREHLKCR